MVKSVHSDGGGTGSLRISGAAIISSPYDYVAVTYPSTVSEQYVFRLGGVAGTLVSTVIVTYTSETKLDLLSIAKT